MDHRCDAEDGSLVRPNQRELASVSRRPVASQQATQNQTQARRIALMNEVRARREPDQRVAAEKAYLQRQGQPRKVTLRDGDIDRRLRAGATRPVRHPETSVRPWSRPKRDRKSTRLNSSHLVISYAVFC